MITIFSIPKAFNGQNAITQRNAIESWIRLGSDVEVILCGKDPGVAETAKALNISHLPDVECTEYGTPLLNSVFNIASEAAKNNLLCYVNADIILLSDFLEAIRQIHIPRFLAVGQRWDLDLRHTLDFNAPDWEDRLRATLKKKASLHPPAGSDYFVFAKDDRLINLPSFAVGRPVWDNWFIYNTRRNRIPVIDSTQAITAIHQNHDYRHVPRGKGIDYEGPEAEKNRAAIGDPSQIFTLVDATHLLTSQGLTRASSPEHLRRYPKVQKILHPFAWPAILLPYYARRLGSIFHRTS